MFTVFPMDSPPETKPSRSGHIWLWIPVTLVLYVLSVGPAMKMEDANVFSPSQKRVLNVFYEPLDWCYRHTWLRKPLDTYIKLWTE